MVYNILLLYNVRMIIYIYILDISNKITLLQLLNKRYLNTINI